MQKCRNKKNIISFIIPTITTSYFLMTGGTCIDTLIDSFLETNHVADSGYVSSIRCTILLL